jgi:hypothetical protein
MAIELLDDERPEDQLNEGEEYSGFDEQEAEQANPEPEEVEDDVPEKYRGKTPAEIAKMHQEAEKLLGRQSSEVGELRKIVDDFVKAQLATKTAQEQSEPEEDVDWYVDPQKAVEKAIANHPKLREAEALTTEMKKAKALNELKSKHPDYTEVIADQGFADWVMASPVRQRLLQQADQQFDLEAADELLSTWKERKGAARTLAVKEQTERKKQVKAASTGATAGSGEAPSRKIYRRADIIKLMQTDPDRYMQLADDIAQAYAEKRVR